MSRLAELIIDSFIENIFPWLVIFFVAGIIAFIPACAYFVYQDSKKPTFTLKKDDWLCAGFREYNSTTYVKSGNVIVPITNHHKYCVQWNHK